MARQQHGQIYVATATFWAINQETGEEIQIVADRTRVREGHWVLVGRADSFKPVDAHYDVEQATNAPGEVRS